MIKYICDICGDEMAKPPSADNYVKIATNPGNQTLLTMDHVHSKCADVLIHKIQSSIPLYIQQIKNSKPEFNASKKR